MVLHKLLGTLYRFARAVQMPLYERYLEEEVRRGSVPNHVAFILDGNRRFAKKVGLSFLEAYRMGAERVEDLLEWMLELGVKHVTLYAFSTENFRRSEEEKKVIFTVIEEKLQKMMDDLDRLRENEVRFRLVGRRELIPERLRTLAERLEALTKDFGKRTLNLALAYGGRAEIVDAVRRIAERIRSGELDPEEIDEDTIREHLYAPDLPDPDLIIRTSGEERLSNFLLWQSAYSELYFLEVYLPELRKIDVLRAIRDYQRRQRRYGS